MPELQRDHRTAPQPLGAATLSGWAPFGVSSADAVLAAAGAYHESEPAKLIERAREGLVRYDAGEIDAFELDDLVHHYKRATQKLWSLRGLGRTRADGGADARVAARAGRAARPVGAGDATPLPRLTRRPHR
jgi:hypothetical protein